MVSAVVSPRAEPYDLHLTMQVLVTGGTGVLGSAVVAELVSRVHSVRVLSRHPRRVPNTARLIAGSLESPAAVADALDGVEAVIHCATDPRKHKVVDREGTRSLLHVMARSGNPHLLYPGIVGSDLIPLGYYKSKTAIEAEIAASPGPFSILRATQFHTLIWGVLESMTRLPLMVVPKDTRFQTIDHQVVARMLVDAMEGKRTGRLDDVGGPNAYSAEELATSHRAATDHGKRILTIPIPGITGAAFRAGGNLTPNRTSEGQTWNDFVAAKL